MYTYIYIHTCIRIFVHIFYIDTQYHMVFSCIYCVVCFCPVGGCTAARHLMIMFQTLDTLWVARSVAPHWMKHMDSPSSECAPSWAPDRLTSTWFSPTLVDHFPRLHPWVFHIYPRSMLTAMGHPRAHIGFSSWSLIIGLIRPIDVERCWEGSICM